MAGISDLVSAAQNAVTGINTLVTALKGTYTQISNTISTTATSGVSTLPSNPTGFAQVTIANVQYKVPLYKP